MIVARDSITDRSGSRYPFLSSIVKTETDEEE